MDVKETFDNEAHEYEFTSRAVNIYFDEALDALINAIQIEPKKILDVCCGTGILTEKVANKFPKSEIVGVDFSQGMLGIARERMKNKNFSTFISDVCDINNMKHLGKYDLIVSSFGIHNIHGIENKRIALKNIFAHLNNGGVFIICDILKGKTTQEQKNYDDFQRDWLLKTYSKEETEAWIKLLREEDDPETLENNIKLLKELGMKNIEKVLQKEFLAILMCSKWSKCNVY